MDSCDERCMRLLSDATNRAVLTVLGDADGALSVTELADALVTRDAAILEPDAYEDEFDRTVISLHHDHLPRLEEAGLVAYDREANVVERGEYGAVDAEWREIGAIDDLLSQFAADGETDESAIGVVDGSDDVYGYCRDLTDRADDELFVIYTSEDLIDERCLGHAKRALERGVDLYAGAKQRDVRTVFQEMLPRATVWEPQLDWMNEHSSYPKVSRLVFADREAVAVGLWNDAPVDGGRRELAMVGEGADNPLVVLVRELLGPRLDHLDFQSEEFLRDLPFES